MPLALIVNCLQDPTQYFPSYQDLYYQDLYLPIHLNLLLSTNYWSPWVSYQCCLHSFCHPPPPSPRRNSYGVLHIDFKLLSGLNTFYLLLKFSLLRTPLPTQLSYHKCFLTIGIKHRSDHWNILSKVQ